MRDTWFEYFFNIVHAVAGRATCDRGKCAAITVKDKRILSTGYVGAAPGLPHCDEVGHLYRTVTHTDGTTKNHCVRTVHAEANAIAQAAKCGIVLADARLYSSMFPCFDCAKLIVAAGISQVYAEFDYVSSGDSKALFTAAGVHWVLIHDLALEYTEEVNDDHN
jgi:dCMP deaminase